ACALHACLNKNTYSPEKCDKDLRRLYECCRDFYAKAGEGAESTACPMPRVLERWFKDHPK
ncbi:hypothetical protein FA13DRAFT_1621355, partial [Coprinellus micaceus]